MNPSNLTRRAKFGLAFIYLAGLGWTVELILPFLHVPHKAPLWVAILIIAELSFVIGIAILGKPAYHHLKAKLFKREPRDPS
jgi:hypothetical protein